MDTIENKEIINEGIENVIDAVVENEAPVVPAGKGLGVMFAVVTGVLAVGAGIKLAIDAYKTHKEKTKLNKPDEEINVEPEDVDEVTGA